VATWGDHPIAAARGPGQDCPGCCGTDHRHVSAIAEVCADLFEPIRAGRSV
jgi:hypothetical protein